MAGIGGLVGGIGGAVSGIFSAEGSGAEADGDFQAALSYRKARDIELQNIDITKTSTEIQGLQLQRKIDKVQGTQTAQLGAAGVSGGSAGDLMRDSAQQGALAVTQVNTQGKIQENAFKAQADAFDAQAIAADAAGHKAESAAQGAMIGGAFSLLGGIVGMI